MNLLQMSLSGAVLIVAIIVIRALFLHKLPKKTFTILWTLVLIRLLLPFSIPSSFSIYSWFPSINSAGESYIADNNTSEKVKNSVFSKNIKETVIKESNTNKLHNYIKYNRAEDFEKTIFPSNEVIRFAGMVVGIIIFLFLYIRNMREFRTSLPINNAFIKDWLVKHKLKRKISVRYSDRISTPLSYGIFRPVILLPKNLDLSDTGLLSYILTHEYVHIKRFDIITKMFLIAALCVHWFNPTVWVMFILFNRDIELSCDEAVVRIFGEKSKEEYAYALIDMEAKKGKFMPLCSNFSKNAVKERIISIMKIKKISLIMSLLAVVFVVGMAVVFMTSAKKDEGKNITRTDNEKNYGSKLKSYEKMSISEYS
ncbi:MAG: M56 family metallopeptidase, partial [Catonella sp.]